MELLGERFGFDVTIPEDGLEFTIDAVIRVYCKLTIVTLVE